MDRGNVQTQGGRVNVSKQKRKTAHGIRRPHAPALILLHQLESSIDDTRTSRLGKLVEELDVLRREPLVLAVALDHVEPISIGGRLAPEVVRAALDDLAPGKPLEDLLARDARHAPLLGAWREIGAEHAVAIDDEHDTVAIAEFGRMDDVPESFLESEMDAPETRLEP